MVAQHFWRSTLFDKFEFDEWYSGVGYMEDVDFFVWCFFKSMHSQFVRKRDAFITTILLPLKNMLRLGVGR